ncbi:DJ-1/PfpI family protein, partial [Escherichia fergusonii]
SANDLISQGFIHTPRLRALVEATRSVDEIDVKAFDAIVVAGGQAPMFTMETAVNLHAKFVEFYTAGKVAAALC